MNERKKAKPVLEKAEQKNTEQKGAIVEEERRKVLLQMAGAKAHELTQPLTTLLGHIELLRVDRDDPEKLLRHLAGIEEAGCRIAAIAGTIQDIRQCEISLPQQDLSALWFEKSLNVLCMEDSDADFEFLKTLLKDRKQINLYRVAGIEEAFALLDQTHFDLIFLEFNLPDGNGLDFLKLLHKKGFEIPAIVITGRGDQVIAAKVIQSGAFDYLPKDLLTGEALWQSLNNALDKFHLKKAMIKAQKKMVEMSTKDALTGLFNRGYFMEALDRELARAVRYQSEVVLCMLDLDHFKRVNDTYGHLAGDSVLAEVGSMLRGYIRESDLLGRYGGDEFVVILTNTDSEKARIVCERFREMVAWHEFTHHAFSFHITVSIGIASYGNAAGLSSMELIELADRALYRAKNIGRNSVIECADQNEWHRPKIGNVFVSEGIITDADLGDALSEQGLRLGEILVKAGRITTEQLGHALDSQNRFSIKVGDMLRQLGHATDEDIAWALARMKRRLGEVLLERGLVKENELQWALAMQHHEPKQLQ